MIMFFHDKRVLRTKWRGSASGVDIMEQSWKHYTFTVTVAGNDKLASKGEFEWQLI